MCIKIYIEQNEQLPSNGMKLPSTNGTYKYAMEESENTECSREKNGIEEVGKIRSRALKDQ